MELPDTTLAWTAALIDGEGTVMLVRHAPGAAAIARIPSLLNSRSYRPRVGVYNTDLRLMDAILDRVGLGRVYTHTRAERENHKKTSYEWRLNSTELRAFLPLVRPWLVLKGEQVDLLLEALRIKSEVTPVKGEKWVHHAMPGGRAIPDRMEEIAAAISELNRKGRR